MASICEQSWEEERIEVDEVGGFEHADSRAFETDDA